MTPHIILTVIGTTAIAATTSVLLIRATPAGAQARTCEHAGRKYQPGDRECIKGLVNVCSATTGRWLATKVKC
jgi:hypothetical protein